MSGHSKWTQIKHKKAGADAKRGILFSKLSRQISLAAREGGNNPNLNLKLRQIIERACSNGMPKENIERAVSKTAVGAGDAKLQEMTYEAYGPGGSAFIISGITDNTNRTTAEIKNILAESGGKLVENGSVSWMFERRGIFEFNLPRDQEEKIELFLIDNGVEDIKIGDDKILAVVDAEKMEIIESGLKKLGLGILTANTVILPKSTVALRPEELNKANDLEKTLKDHQDIIAVSTNIHL